MSSHQQCAIVRSVLVGGLNGGGKTTILDAVQLALYGSRAQVYKREGIPYERFLRNCINRGVDPTDGASVGLQFRYVSKVIAKTLTDRDKKILIRLKERGADKGAIALIKKILNQDRKDRSKLATEPLRHGLSDRTRVAIEKLHSNGDREVTRKNLEDLLAELETIKAKREQLERSLELAPSQTVADRTCGD